jgi:hypothetical protein
VSRVRAAIAVGVLLIVVAIALPCSTLIDLAGTGLPYQDPTAEMLQQQAAHLASLHRRMAVLGWISTGLVLAGVLVLVYAIRTRPERGAADPGTSQATEQS